MSSAPPKPVRAIPHDTDSLVSLEQTGFSGEDKRDHLFDEEPRIRRNAGLIVAIMSIVALVFIGGVAITNPQFLVMALGLGLVVVLLPVITYLYTRRIYHFLGHLFDR